MFVQIVNLLNLDYPSDVGEHLCAEVLATLAALLRDNEANRHRLKADVGYDTLQHVVLSRSSTDGPSKAVLLQVLCLALEVSITDDCQPTEHFLLCHLMRSHGLSSSLVT